MLMFKQQTIHPSHLTQVHNALAISDARVAEAETARAEAAAAQSAWEETEAALEKAVADAEAVDRAAEEVSWLRLITRIYQY